MLSLHAQVFDEIITGTTSTWYTSSQFYEAVGASDTWSIHACASFVSGTNPTLTVYAEHSSDGQD